MSKRVNNKRGNRLRKGVSRMPAADQPCRVRAASGYHFSVLGAQDKYRALVSRHGADTRAVLRRMA